jgi:Phage portal protein
MAWTDFLPGWLKAGRRRHEPSRDTEIYPRLMSIGGQTHTRDRPMIKPTPANLRRFAKTVYARRAIKSVKDPISTLDWVFEPKEGIDLNPELQRQIDIATACFAKPNRDDSFHTFVETLTEDMIVGGAGVLEHQLGGDAVRPLWMWPVDVLSIQIFAGWSGNNADPRYWQALGYGNVGGTRGRPIRNDELTYIKVDPTNENPFGLGAIEIAFSAINRLMGTQDFAGNTASNATPARSLFFEDMDSNTLDKVRTYWRNEIEGQGNTPIFGGGKKLTVSDLRGDTDEHLFLKYQEFLIREIFSAVGVSPQNAGIEKDVNRNTAEVSEDRDWRMTIVPLAKRIAMYLNREIVEESLGFSQIEFKWLGLDRDDEEASADIFKTRYEANMLTPNEERSRLNIPPSDNPFADLLYADVQIAMQAARGSASVDDDGLPKQSNQPAAKPPKPKKKDR